MEVTAVQWMDETEQRAIITLRDGSEWSHVTPDSRFWPAVEAWIDAGNTPDAPPPAPSPPTTDERIDGSLSNPVIKGLVGMLAEDQGITEKALVDRIKAKAAAEVGP